LFSPGEPINLGKRPDQREGVESPGAFVFSLGVIAFRMGVGFCGSGFAESAAAGSVGVVDELQLAAA